MKDPSHFRNNCPECGEKLHLGQHKFKDGVFDIEYCKKCGFRAEKDHI